MCPAAPGPDLVNLVTGPRVIGSVVPPVHGPGRGLARDPAVRLMVGVHVMVPPGEAQIETVNQRSQRR